MSFRWAMTAGGEMMFVAEASGGWRGSPRCTETASTRCTSTRDTPATAWARGFSPSPSAERRGVTRVWLDATLTALPFYQSHSYRRIRRNAAVRHSVPIPVVRMMKML